MKWLILISLLFNASVSYAQWKQMDLPPSINISGFARAGDEFMLCAWPLGIWKYNRDTQSWSEDNLGLTDLHVYAIKGSDKYVVAGNSKGIWIRRTHDSLYRQYPKDFTVPYSSILIVGDTIITVTADRIGRLTLGSAKESWEYSIQLNFGPISAVARDEDGFIYASTREGLYRSSGKLDEWIRCTNMPVEVYTSAIADVETFGNRVYMCHRTTLYYSDDHGESWSTVNNDAWENGISEICISEAGAVAVWLPNFGGTWVSADGGLTFTEVYHDGKTSRSFFESFFDPDENLWGGGRGPWNFSVGDSSALIIKGLPNEDAKVLNEINEHLYLWMDREPILKMDLSFENREVVQTKHYGGGIKLFTLSNEGIGLAHDPHVTPYASIDTCKTWSRMTDFHELISASKACEDGSVLFVGLEQRIYQLDRNGWTPIADKFVHDVSVLINAVKDNSGNVYGITGADELWFWNNDQKRWALHPYQPQASTTINDIEIAHSGKILMCTVDGLFRYDPITKTGGHVGTELNSLKVLKVFSISDDTIIACTIDNIYYTTDGGANWTSIKENMPLRTVTSLLLTSNNVVIASTNGGVFYHDLETFVTVVDDVYEFESQQSTHLLYPNPASNGQTVSIHLPFEQLTTCSVFDLHGNEMLTSLFESNSGGIINNMQFETTALPPGIYAVVVSTPSSVVTSLLTVQ